uniref:Dendritic cell-specific transmembrane protein-like domain-containing protein n=1 Tax=Ornithorhynchus anatinus TaxID=9258 RepID=A0A6I8PM83_ORNAN
MESMPPLLLLLVTCVLDWALYTVFATIRHHSFVQYSYQSSHQLEVKVGGDSLLARLLRSTVGALNTSSSTRVDADNTREARPGERGGAGGAGGEGTGAEGVTPPPPGPVSCPPSPACLPEPRGLDALGYAHVCLPAGLLLLCCLLQAYGYRLRRVIASFYFPKVPGVPRPPHPPPPAAPSPAGPALLLPAFRSRLRRSAAAWPRSSRFTSLGLGSLVCPTGMRSVSPPPPPPRGPPDGLVSTPEAAGLGGGRPGFGAGGREFESQPCHSSAACGRVTSHFSGPRFPHP